MKVETKYISILLGFFYCLSIIWNRLFRTRKPVDLFTEYNTIRIGVYLCLFLVSIMMVIYFVRQALEISSKGIFIKNLLEKPSIIALRYYLQEYILNGPKNLYEWLYIRIYIKPTIDTCCRFMLDYHIGEKPLILKSIILSILSIRLVVCIAFIHGIFFLHNFNYFFKCLVLLLVPILFSIFLYSIKYLATDNKEAIETFIHIKEDPDNEDGWIISRTEEYSYLSDEQVTGNAKMWERYCYAKSTIEYYYILDVEIKLYFNIFYYSFYAIGWGYILYRIYLNEYISLSVEVFEWLWIIQDMEEPFSLTNIYKSTNQQ
jgi:hypothetical protein